MTKIIKNILMIVGGLFIFLFIVGLIIGGTDTNENSDTSVSDEKTTKVDGVDDEPTQVVEDTEEEVMNSKDVYNVGETAEMNGRQITVNTVEFRDSISRYSTPETGNHYALVNVTIVNQRDNDLGFSTTDFKVESADGRLYDTTFVGDIDNELDGFGELRPRGKTNGNVAFEIPKDGELKLVYEAAIWTSDEIIFAIR